MNKHLKKVHSHIKIHHKKYLLAGVIGGVGFFALKSILFLLGIVGIFQRNQDTYALDSSLCTEVLDVSLSECQALVGIYTSTQGDTSWAPAKRNTRGSTGNICGVWAGVGCDGGGHVNSLNLNQFLLEGPIDLSNLTYLNYLNLGGNLQLGTISGLGFLSSLTYLDLSTINLQSKGIPSGLSSLVGLETISLQSNGLTSIPAALPQMVGLKTIILSNNLLNSSNTPSISLPNLTILETLDLESNQFTTLPSISNTNIQTLKLAYNSSLYSIDNVVSLSSLETIDAKYCSIDSLPDIDNLTNLRFLNLYSNDIYNFGLNTFTNLSLPAGGDIRENCLTIYQTGGDSLYNYFTSHSNIQYVGQDTSCGHIYNTAPSCTAQYDHSLGTWTNSTVRATVSCNDSYSVRPADNISPSYWDFYDNSDGPYSFSISNSIWGRGDTISNVDFDWIDKEDPTCGSVTYTPGSTAADPVTASVSCSDSPSGVNGSQSVTSRQYPTNGTYTNANGLYATDMAGNRTYVPVTIAGIIERYPSCSTVFTPNGWTSGNVTVSLTSCSGQPTIIGTNRTQEFTQNGNFSTNITDGDGDITNITGTISNIDKVAPTCNPTIVYSPAHITGTRVTGNVTATLVGCSDTGGPGSPATPSGISSSSSHTGYVFTDSGQHTLYIVDNVGNRTNYTAQVSWIDKGYPTCSVFYSTTSPTNTDVTATLTGCSESITVTNTFGGWSGYIFTGNGSFVFQFKDVAGNTGSIIADVSNIDKDVPICGISHNVTGSFSQKTSQNVLSSLTGCSEPIIVTKPTNGTGEYLFTGNGEFTFEFMDLAGNTGSYKDLVYRIDNESPWCTISYTPNSNTSSDVIATLSSCSKSPIFVTNNSFSTNYIFKGNGNFTFEYRDALGNTGFTTATVTWISKSSGGGGRGKDICLDGDFSSSYYDGTCKSSITHSSAPSCEVDKPYKYSDEQVEAFERAYSLGITTICPIEKEGINSNLIRKHMAKMISEFAIDIIGMEPDRSKACNFSDISKEKDEIKNYIKLSCQLGLMGYQTDGVTKKSKFEPNKIVSKAQLAAILSRLIWGTKYAGGEPYFKEHAQALKKNNIMDKSVYVFMAPQLRGQMLIMLMRAKDYLEK